MTGEGYALAREELVRTLTAYSGVTTADGASGGTSLIDSDLAGKNDFLKGKSILIMSGAAQYETAGIIAFYPTATAEHVAGEITIATPFSAQIVAGVSFRVLNVLPESVHISSGQVQLQGWDYESGEWRKVRVTGSGEIAIHVTVADIVTAKISGETVYLASGTGPILAKVSGETVIAKISGETHALASGTGPVLAKVSGETVIAKISGETVIAKISGETVIGKVSGQSVVVTSGQVVAKISGEAVKVSGETVIAKVSGETVSLPVTQVVKISGETVVAKVSGETVSLPATQVVKISGETVIAKVSGEVVKISGETVSIETPTSIKTGPIQVITAASGGQVLYSGAIKSVVVKALTDNSGMIAVGGATDRPWYEAVCSGQGLILDGAEAVSLDVSDFDDVYVVAEVSGDQVSFLGVN